LTRFVGLDVSQKMTAICVIDHAGRRLWRGQCPTIPEQISGLVRRHAGDDVRAGIETGAMTPWLVHELRNLGFEVVCLDASGATLTKATGGAARIPRMQRYRWESSVSLNPLDMRVPPSRCRSTRRIRTPRRDWLRSFAPSGTVQFMSNRLIATARVLIWAQGLNSSV